MTLLIFFVFLAASLVAGSTAAFFPTGTWYKSLTKPSWTPPNWVFPIAWTTIYITISYAGARVAMLDENGLALALFALQFSLNTLWTPVFFGLQRMDAGLIVVCALWLTVAASAVAFWQLDAVAGILLLPYLAWVTVASALNFSVWRLNPDPAPLR